MSKPNWKNFIDFPSVTVNSRDDWGCVEETERDRWKERKWWIGKWVVRTVFLS